MPCLVWFRLDLRLADNPALLAGVSRGEPIIPVFIYAPEEEAPWGPGAASRWWLHHSLEALQVALQQAGLRLVLRRGPSLATLRGLVKETGATAVYWNRRYEPVVTTRDAAIKEALSGDGLEVQSFNSALLHEPWTLTNRSGKPFQVFTPFWKHCLGLQEPLEPRPAPRTLLAPPRWPKSLALAELGLEPTSDWAGGLRAAWQPGEASAIKALRSFMAGAFDTYAADRNRPDLEGTSRLSPHLHFGEISPRQVWHGLKQRAASRGLGVESWRGSSFLAELGWREFAHHLLYHFPHTPAEPLRREFKGFPWRHGAHLLRAWQRGRTGYPLVDAGTRQLWATGWMHNRVRMVVASFLVKDLMVSWTEGARWFWDTLVDADLAQNTLGWQWTAGCGADAAPFFRVFNPVSQGERFDPCGSYVRRWCPELARLPDEWVHKPGGAPEEILAHAGVRLGRDYPAPVVSHAIAREVALEAFGKLKSRAPKTEPVPGSRVA